MKILFIADGRSPTARSWIKNVSSFGDELHLLTTYPCQPIEGILSITFLPLAFSQVGRSSASGNAVQYSFASEGRRQSITGKTISRFRKAFLALRYYIGPISLSFTAGTYRELIDHIRPDLIHALRIPYEGMIAAYTPKEYKVIVSSWGNDFTLHAGKTLLMKKATQRAVRRADGFMADCLCDIRRAKEWGLCMDASTMFAPGSGGLDIEVIEKKRELEITRKAGVINPRGIRPVYVLNDQFFQALPEVLAKYPDLPVYCAAMQGENDAERWVRALNLPENVHLLAGMPQDQLWDYSLRSTVVVSPAIHDGTPNSVLESMALGCLPVVGNIEPLREWITDGENGLLVDPYDPRSITDGILRGIEDEDLRERAQQMNWQIVAERADRAKVMPQVHQFYLDVLKKPLSV